MITLRSSHRKCSIKKMLLNILQKSQENTCPKISFLVKLQTSTSCYQRCSIKKGGVLNNFAKLTGKHLCRSLFSNKITGWKPNGSSTSFFLCILRNFWTPFLLSTSSWLFLYIGDNSESFKWLIKVYGKL